jgi:O-antigen/teichoic acid export membrane protein
MNAKKRVFKNSFYLISSSLTCRGMLFLIIYYMAIKMGSKNLGVYAFAQSFFVFGVYFSNLGMRLYGVREVVKDQKNYSKVYSELFMLGFLMKLILFVVLACFILFLGFSKEKLTVCILFLAAIFPDIIIAPANVMFNATEKLGCPAVIDVLSRICYAVTALLIIKFRANLVEIALSNLICYFLGSLVLLYYSNKMFEFPSLRFNFSNLYKRFKALIPFALINVFAIIYMGIDVMMLGIMRGDQPVGWYKIGNLIPQEGMFLLRFFSLSLIPMLTRYYMKSKEDLTKQVLRLVKFYSILILPFTLLLSFYAKDVLLLFFPPEYFRSSYALMILIWFVPLQYICSPFLIALQIADKQVIITKISAFLALLNVVLNLIFIYLIGGDYVCIGPAIGTSASTFIAVFLIIKTYNRNICKVDFYSLIRKPMFAFSITTIGLVLFYRTMNPVITSIFVISIYFLLLRFLGEFSFVQVSGFFKEFGRKQ